MHGKKKLKNVTWFIRGAGIEQLVQLLATAWKVRELNPGVCEIFHTYPDWPWGPRSLL